MMHAILIVSAAATLVAYVITLWDAGELTPQD
jgi:hypothetical protein